MSHKVAKRKKKKHTKKKTARKASQENIKLRQREMESEKAKMEEYVNQNKASKELRHLKAI